MSKQSQIVRNAHIVQLRLYVADLCSLSNYCLNYDKFRYLDSRFASSECAESSVKSLKRERFSPRTFLFHSKRFSIFNYTKISDEIYASRDCIWGQQRFWEQIFNSFQRNNDPDTLKAWFLRIPFLHYVFYVSKYIFMKNEFRVWTLRLFVHSTANEKHFIQIHQKSLPILTSALFVRGLRRRIVMRNLTASAFHRWEIKQTSTIPKTSKNSSKHLKSTKNRRVCNVSRAGCSKLKLA